MLALDKAIKHCEEVIEEQEENAWEAELQEEYSKIKPCKECAAEHKQLAEWLTKLKRYEDGINRIIDKIDEAQWCGWNEQAQGLRYALKLLGVEE